MANFTPSGRIHIGRVPFDNSYQHTVVMNSWSAAAQAQDMIGKMNTSLSKSDYKYVRMNNSIRVNFNAESLYTYNYVMYQNSNYGNKWFYAFITDCIYINENCTELRLELDIIQTWWFELNLKQCFVEREHVTDDSLDAHLNPEPEMPFESTAQNAGYIGDLEDTVVVLATNNLPIYIGGEPIPFTSDAVSGGIYTNIMSGAKYYGFRTDSSTQIDFLQKTLRGLNQSGVIRSVSDIFMLPASYVPIDVSDYSVNVGTQPVSNTYNLTRPTNLHGYTPKNNKLFTYPYCYARLRHANVEYTELKYELWNSEDGYTVRVTVPIDPSSTVFAIPEGYQGIADNTAAMLSFGYDVHCSYPIDAFANWLGQNALSMALTAAGGAAVLGTKATTGLAAASKQMTTTTRMASQTGYAKINSRGQWSMSMLNRSPEVTLTDSIRSPSTLSPEGAQALAGAGAASMIGEVSRAGTQPNTTSSGASGNALMGVSFEDIRWENICILPEFAKIIDGFFDMFGYQVDSVKVPNVDTRSYWNYVKTTNACHWGNIPADDLAGINSIFNSGITFWHTWDVGNYDLDNTI